jgi:hypothetical protein
LTFNGLHDIILQKIAFFRKRLFEKREVTASPAVFIALG